MQKGRDLRIFFFLPSLSAEHKLIYRAVTFRSLVNWCLDPWLMGFLLSVRPKLVQPKLLFRVLTALLADMACFDDGT